MGINKPTEKAFALLSNYLHLFLKDGEQPGELVLKGQCAKKVASDSPGLVDFAIGLGNSVVNLPDGQVIFLNSNNRRITEEL